MHRSPTVFIQSLQEIDTSFASLSANLGCVPGFTSVLESSQDKLQEYVIKSKGFYFKKQ